MSEQETRIEEKMERAEEIKSFLGQRHTLNEWVEWYNRLAGETLYPEFSGPEGEEELDQDGFIRRTLLRLTMVTGSFEAQKRVENLIEEALEKS
jgi:hypothetical protein